MEKELLYIALANLVQNQINDGTLKLGDKLPSLRTVALETGVSMSTALLAYVELEKRALISSRPKSGYFVSYVPALTDRQPSVTDPVYAYREDTPEQLLMSVSKNKARIKVDLSAGVPDASLLPVAKMNKAIVEAVRSLPAGGLNYDRIGNLNLKQQIAQRSMMWGGKLQPDDIVLTSGSMDAISFCLMSVLKKGDSIIVESPLYFGILQLAQSLGLNVIEMPTHPVTGIEIEAVEKMVAKRKIGAIMLVSNFSNPTGSCMPDDHKREIVRIAEQSNVPIIEDDLFGDLYFGRQRPHCCKSFDKSGIVMLCSSFSKTLAPGYRVGWCAPGQFKEKVAMTKYLHSLCTTSVTHEAVGRFLENGRYENHLRKMRNALHTNMLRIQRAVADYLPEHTKVSSPEGGLHLWIEFDKRIDTVELYNELIGKGINIAPGRLFTLRNQYRNCMKINFGHPWNPAIERAFKVMGQWVKFHVIS